MSDFEETIPLRSSRAIGEGFLNGERSQKIQPQLYTLFPMQPEFSAYDIERMKQILLNACKQALPIFISALLAAMITFLQALLTHMVAPADPNTSVYTAGALGAGIKAIHTALGSTQNNNA